MYIVNGDSGQKDIQEGKQKIWEKKMDFVMKLAGQGRIVLNDFAFHVKA